ncbi:hypothetical protein GEMRC1_007902 [Eukaryota sp. GEM-RC1]
MSVSVEYGSSVPSIKASWSCVPKASFYYVSLFNDDSLLQNKSSNECFLVFEEDLEPDQKLSVVIQGVSSAEVVGVSSSPFFFELHPPVVKNTPRFGDNSAILMVGGLLLGASLAGLLTGCYVRRSRHRRRLISRQYIVSVPLTPLDTPQNIEE